MNLSSSEKKRYLWYGLASLFAGGGILLAILIRLFFAHPEVEICDFDLKSIRPCSWFSKIAYLSSIVERKIVFSYYWDNVAAELREKNPGWKSADIKPEIYYTGYGIEINGSGTVDDLSPLNKIPLMGLIIIKDKVQFSPPKASADCPNLVISYKQAGKSQIFNETLFRNETDFWGKLNVELRMY
jgi:hypothetical protein